MNDNSFDAQLAQAELAISNALTNAPILNLLKTRNYDEAKLQIGAALVDHAKKLNEKQKKEYGEQYAATDEMHRLRDECHSVYIDHISLARVVFKNDRGAQEQLGLRGKRKRTFPGWVAQTNLFYSNALENPELLEKLAELNITEEELSEGKALANAVNEAWSKQKKERGEAQHITEKRDEVIEKLDDWYGDFIEVARVTLSKEPQLLEILGIKS